MVLKIIIYIFLFSLSSSICCQTLINQLNNFLKKEYPFHYHSISIKMHTPLKNIMFCNNPTFFLPNYFYYLRNMNVFATCGKQHQNLNIEFNVIGEYIAASRKIPKGTKILESDIKVVIGQLNSLPKNTYLQKKDVINRLNIRDIESLQPITSLITQPYWLVRINQPVKIVMKGVNFQIISRGKSLVNGIKDDIIRIRTDSGKILTGILHKKGQVIINMKEW